MAQHMHEPFYPEPLYDVRERVFVFIIQGSQINHLEFELAAAP